jgi:uncharacterized lipoprotein YddW (UPF0748 family)
MRLTRPIIVTKAILSIISLGFVPVLLSATCARDQGLRRGSDTDRRADDERRVDDERREVIRPPRPEEVWPPHAMWVVRETYETEDEIAQVMENCKQAGMNTVLYQVRGNATAWYRSSIEPFAYEYKQGDPGFDPLMVACREAHRRGMAIHAWVNVMPAWRGNAPPADLQQLYHTRPEWFWYDQAGQRQPLGKFYVSLNPCLPEVRAYLVGVFREIVERYPVDGLHLDYIRFPNELNKGKDYPRDKKTLALYRKDTGKAPSDDPAKWTQWRVAQVTQLVEDIRKMTRDVRPRALLTAAVGHDIDRYRNVHFQDGPGWLRKGLVDMLFVMNYARDVQSYKLRQEAWFRIGGRERVAPGLGLYLHESDRISLEQLELARKWGNGFGLFSYTTLFDGSPRSRQRFEALQPMLLEMAGRMPQQSRDSNVRVGVSAGHRTGQPLRGRSQPPDPPKRPIMP